MVYKKSLTVGRAALALLVLILPFFAALVAPSRAAAEETDYSYTIDNEGNPVFTQRLHWRGDPNALRYELALYDQAGIEIDLISTERESVELHLKPGSYTYVLTMYNLLGQVEYSSDRVPLTVLRAEMPVIASTRPAVIYMEGKKPTVVTVEGSSLVDGAEFALMDQSGKGGGGIVGVVIQHRDDQYVIVEFPRDKMRFGSYRVRVTNPGGLAVSSDRTIKVKYEKPMDFFIAVDYSPVFPLYDAFYKDNWSDTFYPLGGGARVGLYFLKRRFASFGAEIHGTIRSMGGGIPEATIETSQRSIGAGLLFAYKLSPALRLTAGAGGGLSAVNLRFDYEGTSGESLDTSDPFATAGLSAQWFFLKKVYAEFGADWSHVFRKGYVEGLVSPRFSLGWYF